MTEELFLKTEFCQQTGIDKKKCSSLLFILYKKNSNQQNYIYSEILKNINTTECKIIKNTAQRNWRQEYLMAL